MTRSIQGQARIRLLNAVIRQMMAKERKDFLTYADLRTTSDDCRIAHRLLFENPKDWQNQ